MAAIDPDDPGSSAWSTLEVAMWRDSGGLFVPKPPAAAPRGAAGDVLVSVVCPTMASRRCFHAFLWMCFKIQTYKPLELVVVETCEEDPSEFLEQMSREYPHVVYRHFRVQESRWSIGLKRNLGCYYASGQVIAHFDDDDMYGPSYLEDMMRYLCNPQEAFSLAGPRLGVNNLYQKMVSAMGAGQAVSPPGLADALQGVRRKWDLGAFGAACAKLSCWHEFTLRSHAWGEFDTTEFGDSSLFGWGFSLVYLRSVWEAHPFRHIDVGEDYHFVQDLRFIGMPVILVHDSKGICAHTTHADNITGGDPETNRRQDNIAHQYSPVASLVDLYERAATGILARQEKDMREKSRARLKEGDSSHQGKSAPDRAGSSNSAVGVTKVVPAQPPSGQSAPTPQTGPSKVSAAAARRAPADAPKQPRPTKEPPALPPRVRFCIASSGDNWSSVEDMGWDGLSYRYAGRLAARGDRFRILRGGSWDAVLHPSVHDATPRAPHVLQGPDMNPQGFSWRLPSEREPAEGYEIVLSCPEKCPLSVDWRECGGPGEGAARAAAGPAQGGPCHPRPLKQELAGWRLTRELGRGRHAAAVFAAESEAREAAVKFPVSVREMQHLSAAQDVPGIPRLLDFGRGPGDSIFHATPLLGESLDSILRRCDHDGLGGRVSWPAAKSLGRALLKTLQGLHAKGLLHRNLAPEHVVVGADDMVPHLISFGLSCGTRSHSLGGEGVVDYSSVAAGFPGERTCADDLESLGWLLWRCVLGRLPWHQRQEDVGRMGPEERQRMSENVSRSKVQVLKSRFSAFGSRFAYCPEELQAYLRRVRSLTAPDNLYIDLAASLEETDGGHHWADAVAGRPRAVYEAAAGKIFWRREGSQRSLDAETVHGKPGVCVAVTGRQERLDGGLWAELDPAWAPDFPTELSCGGWVLVADWVGQLLAPVERPEEGQADGRGPDAQQETRNDEDDEEAAKQDEEEEEREVQAVAAQAAQAYMSGLH